tara:strand:+ start:152 stop:1330 length:1179 start_codon:yes stop_codon:yes gene_type:complete
MIPLVYEHDWKPNVWFPNVTGYDRKDILRNKKYDRQIPCLLQQCEDIKIYKSSDVHNLSCFIYPIIMQEPIFQAQVIIQNDHKDWGLWSYIDKQVINTLRSGKGYIFIDITIEPLPDSILKQILDSLEDYSKFPNNRIIINSFSQTYIDKTRVFNLPSYIETYSNFVDKKQDEHKVIDKKIYSMFNIRSDKHVGSLLALSMLDRLNFLKEGYISSDILDLQSAWNKIKYQLPNDSKLRYLQLDSIKNTKDVYLKPIDITDSLKLSNINIVIEAYYNDYPKYRYPLITEKLWRNIFLKKPFILVGQKNTLKYFNNLGYKTFHPYIDESYDNLEDDYRVKAAINQVIKLINFTDKQWISFFNNINPILEHNISNYYNRIQKIHNFIELVLSNKL